MKYKPHRSQHFEELKSSSRLADEKNISTNNEGLLFSSTRYYVVFSAIVIFICFILWLFFAQYFFNILPSDKRNSSSLETIVNSRIQRTQVIEPVRGEITDINGNILAISTPFYNFIISPHNYLGSIIRTPEFIYSEKVKSFLAKHNLGYRDIQDLLFVNAQSFGIEEVVKKSASSSEQATKEGNNKGQSSSLKIIGSQAQDLKDDEIVIIKNQIDFNKLPPLNKELFALVREAAQADSRLKVLVDALADYKNVNELLDVLFSNPSSQYRLLGKFISPTIANYVRSLNITGLTFDIQYKRFYPYGEVVAPLTGLVQIENKNVNGKEVTYYRGLSGIEKLSDSALKGQVGHITYEKDFKNNVINYLEKTDPHNGEDIKLTIDINLQILAYEALSRAMKERNAKRGSVALIEIKTGAIKALVSAPSFNPNDRSSLSPEEINNMTLKPVVDVFMPASTVKPFVVYAGLEAGVMDLNTEFRGYVVPVTKRFAVKDCCHDRKTAKEILKYSSNVGAYKIILATGEQKVWDVFHRVGFGRYTALGLNGESRGIFPEKDKKFSATDVANFSFGYIQALTALQIARAYAVLGGDGIYRDLKILDKQATDSGEQVLNPKYSRQVIEIMKAVAQDRDGTGRRARIEGYNISVKTGTGEIREKDATHPEGIIKKNIAYTAGVAPSSNPQYALVVSIYDPGDGVHGGEVAGPVWKEIMEATLRSANIPEDRMPINKVVIGDTANPRPVSK